MSDHEFVALLRAGIKEIAREAFQEFARDYIPGPSPEDDAPRNLREQIALIKSKAHHDKRSGAASVVL